MLFTEDAFGLDISERKLRLAQVRRSTLVSFGEIDMPAGIISEGEIRQPAKMVEAIAKLLRQAQGQRVKTRNVIAVLPEPKTFIKVLTVTPNENQEMEEAIMAELGKHVPVEQDQSYTDWQRLNQGSQGSTVLVGIAPSAIVNSYLAVLRQADLLPLALEIEAAAILRALFADGDSQPRVVIDFGAGRTGLVMAVGNTPLFTSSLPISGRKITEQIATTLNLQPEQAEQAKLICGLDPQKCEGALLKILTAPISQLAVEIRQALDYYDKTFGRQRPVAEIVLTGGGANFQGIDQVLSQRLKLPVRIGNPTARLSAGRKVKIPASQQLSYTTAIGLALRGARGQF